MRKILILSVSALLGSMACDNCLCKISLKTGIGNILNTAKNQLNKSKTGAAVVSAIGAIGVAGKNVAQTEVVYYVKQTAIPNIQTQIANLSSQVSLYKNQLTQQTNVYKQNIMNVVNSTAQMAAGNISSCLNNVQVCTQKIESSINKLGIYEKSITSINMQINTINKQITTLQENRSQTTDTATASMLQSTINSQQSQLSVLQQEKANAEKNYLIAQNELNNASQQKSNALIQLQNITNQAGNQYLQNVVSSYIATETNISKFESSLNNLNLLGSKLIQIGQKTHSSVNELKADIQANGISGIALNIQASLASTELAQNASLLYNNVTDLNNIDNVGASIINLGTNAAVNKINTYGATVQQSTIQVVPQYQGVTVAQ